MFCHFWPYLFVLFYQCLQNISRNISTDCSIKKRLALWGEMEMVCKRLFELDSGNAQGNCQFLLQLLLCLGFWRVNNSLNQLKIICRYFVFSITWHIWPHTVQEYISVLLFSPYHNNFIEINAMNRFIKLTLCYLILVQIKTQNIPQLLQNQIL